jgi:hypothetical protein
MKAPIQATTIPKIIPTSGPSPLEPDSSSYLMAPTSLIIPYTSTKPEFIFILFIKVNIYKWILLYILLKYNIIKKL